MKKPFTQPPPKRVERLLKRPLDIACIVQFVYDILFLCVFLGQACIPHVVYIPPIRELTNSWSDVTGDYLMQHPPNWFQFGVWIDLVVMIPFRCAAIWSFWKAIKWVRQLTVLYAAFVSSFVLLTLGEFWLSHLDATQILMITALHSPRIVGCILMAIYLLRFPDFKVVGGRFLQLQAVEDTMQRTRTAYGHSSLNSNKTTPEESKLVNLMKEATRMAVLESLRGGRTHHSEELSQLKEAAKFLDKVPQESELQHSQSVQSPDSQKMESESVTSDQGHAFDEPPPLNVPIHQPLERQLTPTKLPLRAKLPAIPDQHHRTNWDDTVVDYTSEPREFSDVAFGEIKAPANIKPFSRHNSFMRN